MVGVCIKYFHANYGGMLQAYATVSMLEKMGIEYELIQYKKKKSLKMIIKFIPRLFNRVLINDKYEALRKKIGIKKHPEFAQNNNIRMEAFRRFKEEHFIKLSPIFEGYESLKKGARRYTAVISGSDQLWSPAGLPTNYYNLMFVPSDIRKISYASSFGVKDIPWYQKKRTAKFLNRLDFISMRENRGSEIVKELTGRTVPTILDPVFMFNEEEWKRLIPEKKIIKEPYIFAYFLGENMEHRKAVEKVAQKLNCKIVTLRHLDQYIEEDEKFGDVALYNIGPDDFLNLLRGANYVCTDSFHGACFSIINRKQFVVFNRYLEKSKHSKNSRIDTLCTNLGLTSQRFRKSETLEEQLNDLIDYKKVEDKFDNLKIKTDEYITQAFKKIH